MDIHVKIVISTEATHVNDFGYSSSALSLTSFKSFLLENILYTLQVLENNAPNAIENPIVKVKVRN